MTLPLPPDEGERLFALDALQILDTPPEPAFDRIARLAARALGAPMAMVSLVDEQRQWAKARVGIAVAETPRAHAFCAHTILDAAPLVVADAPADPRFGASPIVAGAPHVQFYAGAPVRNAEGRALGTVCVMDSVPREIDEADLAALADLAAAAADALERHALRLGAAEAAARTARLEAERARLVSHDAVSGALNRHSLLCQGEREMRRARRYKRPLAVMIADIDRFRRINETFGHAVGDAVLKRFAAFCRAHLREHDLIGRYGGDEFAILLPETDEDGVEEMAARLRHGPAEFEVATSDGMFRFTVSLGVTLCRVGGETFEQALDRAEAALTEAKAAGRARVSHRAEAAEGAPVLSFAGS